jgi:hypothetical protein
MATIISATTMPATIVNATSIRGAMFGRIIGVSIRCTRTTTRIRSTVIHSFAEFVTGITTLTDTNRTGPRTRLRIVILGEHSTGDRRVTLGEWLY